MMHRFLLCTDFAYRFQQISRPYRRKIPTVQSLLLPVHSSPNMLQGCWAEFLNKIHNNDRMSINHPLIQLSTISLSSFPFSNFLTRLFNPSNFIAYMAYFRASSGRFINVLVAMLNFQ